jgi:hypothetical protein
MAFKAYKGFPPGDQVLLIAVMFYDIQPSFREELCGYESAGYG